MDPSVAVAHDGDRPLPVAGFKGTPEEIERQWYEQVYRGQGDSMAQLTWRAVLVGSCLGAVLSLTNLYIGLKAGWGFGVAITACILSYAIWTSLLKIGIARTPMTILENNCMQSTASSAGYSTGGTLVSAFAAYIIINQHSMSVPLMLAWVFFIAVLGVTMAIPMKRQMINIEQLRFPSGIAAAETLRALHAKSSQGLRAAKALGLAGLIAAIDKFWAEGLSTISATSRTLFEWGAADRPAEVAPRQPLRRLGGPHRPLFLGFHLSRRRRHHRHAGLRDHARLGHVVLGRGRADPPGERRR